MTPDDFWQDVNDPTRPPIVLPDIGTFFNQDIDLALSLVEAVKVAGARYIKGEILHDADICLATDVSEQYLGSNAQPVRENYRQLIERKTLTLDQYQQIFAPCRELGMGLLLSVYDQAGADFAVNMGVCALKVASSNIVHAPLIRYCASLKLPLIIDSGKSSREEVIRAIHWAQQAGAERLILEYSPPAPPAPVEQHNLRAISDLRKIFSGPLGLSDHHAGEEMLYAASALGYRLLEKGLCADNQFTDQDVFHALPLSQLATVMEKCRAIHAALGAASAAYTVPTKRPAARMGLVAAINLDVGDSLDSNTVRFAFPTLGIPVEDWDKVRQLQIKTPVAAGQPIEWQHVESTTAR